MTYSVFCDGSCKGNGRKGAVGGWAWAFWSGSVRGEPTRCGSAPLPAEPKPTNQRAELTALLEAVRWLESQNIGPLTIYTDSMYAINCTSKWGPGWKKAGWKRSSNEPLQNLDLIKPLVDIWKSKWKLQHVYGHQSNQSSEAYGNNWVDRAAVEGAVRNPEPFEAPDTPIESPSPTPSQPKTPKINPVYQDIRRWFS